jgi:DNA ligase (NAD+)
MEEAGLSASRAEDFYRTIRSDSANDQLESYADDPEKAEAEVAKSLYNFLDEREESKETTLDRFLYALGIHHVGSHVATVIAREYETIEDVMEANEDELVEIHGVGPEVAESVVHFFSDEKNRSIVHDLLDAGVNPEPIQDEQADVLEDATFVFTGGLDRMTRDEARTLIESLGGRATSSVSGNTDYLVAGENPGSTKMSDAEEYDTSVLNEGDFYTFLRDETGNDLEGLLESA